MVLREFCSPVPAQTCIVSEGAMARAPIETTGSSSKTGRKVVPALVVFQIPPPAAATKKVLDGLGMPTMSATRPSKFAGPTVRQRKPARVRESMDCAPTTVATLVSATPARSGAIRKRCIRTPEGGTEVECGNDTVTERRRRVLKAPVLDATRTGARHCPQCARGRLLSAAREFSHPL